MGVGLEHQGAQAPHTACGCSQAPLLDEKLWLLLGIGKLVTLQDEQEVEGLYSNTEALVGLRPWLFGSLI